MSLSMVSCLIASVTLHKSICQVFLVSLITYLYNPDEEYVRNLEAVVATAFIQPAFGLLVQPHFKNRQLQIQLYTTMYYTMTPRSTVIDSFLSTCKVVI
jgi:hypothetical protein